MFSNLALGLGFFQLEILLIYVCSRRSVVATLSRSYAGLHLLEPVEAGIQMGFRVLQVLVRVCFVDFVLVVCEF